MKWSNLICKFWALTYPKATTHRVRKFEHSKTFGHICAGSSNLAWVPSKLLRGENAASAGTAIVGANEEVLCWDVKKGELVDRWVENGSTAQVTVIRQSRSDVDIFAVGYEDGTIRIWDFRTAKPIVVFTGHRSAVTDLQFDPSGVRLASGSKDTDIILWDLITERGLFRLKGHKDQITSLCFLETPSDASQLGGTAPDEDELLGFLVSAGKDALIKVWDLFSQHCVETHVSQVNGECWALGISTDQSACISAGNQGELHSWSIDAKSLRSEPLQPHRRILNHRGAFYRHSNSRTTGIVFHPSHHLIALHGSEKAVELWRIRSPGEVQKKLARKKKRKREKGSAVETDAPDIPNGGKMQHPSEASIDDIFELYVIVRTGGKVGSIAWATEKPGKAVSILVGTSNNQLEVYNIGYPAKKVGKDHPPDYHRAFSLGVPGHRAVVRSLALSSDDRMLASASHGSLKIWDTSTQTCIRTLECGYALSVAFLPGDKIVVVGTREGSLELMDIASSTLLDTIKAHERDLWSLQVRPDDKSLVTGSADKSVKFWDFRIVQEPVLGSTRKFSKLDLVHTRTLKVTDDVLVVRYSPDTRLLAISTLDNTVKVFYSDSLKLFLTLYGHKLPVLSIDISYDSKLIVTSSADKNVRIWGLDFGDCHKAFFAHQDSIMSVAFVPGNLDGNGHHFFSASKDRVIKYFDADKFDQIQKLTGHHGEIWAIAVARSGQFLVSASHDRSIRLWQQTDEQLFLEEEREKELEDMYESTLLKSFDQADREAEAGGDEQLIRPGRQTTFTLTAGEKIGEALQIGLDDLELMKEYGKLKATNMSAVAPPRNPVYLANNGISASAYLLRVLQRIPPANLQDALLVLSFSQLSALFTFLSIWASERRAVPLTCRILFFVLKLHHKQLVASRLMKPLLQDLRCHLQSALQEQRKEMGFNIAGLRVTGRRLHELGHSDYIDEDSINPPSSITRKRAFINIA